jgi:hypothetical protein
MKFCDADACQSCALPEGSPACLRHKARFCTWLAAKTSSEPVRTALEKMSLDLMEDANALEQEQMLKEVG